MKAKLALLIGASPGYVLGTRDGRQRYEQLKTKAEELWHDPKVQDKVSQVAGSVSSTAASGQDTQSGGSAADTGAAVPGSQADAAGKTTSRTTSKATSKTTSKAGGADD
jgi:hypothetical protein